MDRFDVVSSQLRLRVNSVTLRRNTSRVQVSSGGMNTSKQFAKLTQLTIKQLPKQQLDRITMSICDNPKFEKTISLPELLVQKRTDTLSESNTGDDTKWPGCGL